jgi:ferritin-like metal-binding protein YciE
MQIESLQRIWIHDLKDLQSADRQIADALQRFIEAASKDELKDVLSDHLRETKSQLARLEAILGGLDSSAAAPCQEGRSQPPEAEKMGHAAEAERFVRAAAPRSTSPLDDTSQFAARWTAIASTESLSDQDELASLEQARDDEPALDRTTSRMRGERRRFQRDARVAVPD